MNRVSTEPSADHQPPWWHGDPYDLSDTINAVAELVLDPSMFFTDPRTHPAHHPSIPDAA